MKSLLTTIAISLFFNCTLFGQSVSYLTSVTTSGDSAIVRMVAAFGYTFGDGSCPQLQFFSYEAVGNNLTLNFFYDITGSKLPDGGCGTDDTVHLTSLIPGNAYTLKIIANAIEAGDTIYNTSNKTFNFSLVSSSPNLLSQNISLYPNPTTEAVTINFNGTTAEIRTVEIMDLYGRLIRKVIVDPARTEISIPVTELPAGLYFCAVRDENKVQQLRFVKQ